MREPTTLLRCLRPDCYGSVVRVSPELFLCTRCEQQYAAELVQVTSLEVWGALALHGVYRDRRAGVTLRVTSGPDETPLVTRIETRRAKRLRRRLMRRN